MAENFDPYYKWLGIPPKHQPPDHYRLLGIELFESDPDVIEVAAEKQINYLRACATGPHVNFSQKLLNEVSAARLCLLNPAKKAAYDAALKAAPAEVIVADEPPAEAALASVVEWTADQAAMPSGKESGLRKNSRHRKGPSPVGIIFSSLLGLALAAAIYIWLQNRPAGAGREQPQQQARNIGAEKPLAAQAGVEATAAGSATGKESKPREGQAERPPEKARPHEPETGPGTVGVPSRTVSAAKHEPELPARPEQAVPASPAALDKPAANPGGAGKVADSGMPAPPLPLAEREAALMKLNAAAATPAELSAVAEKGLDLVAEAIASGDFAGAKRIVAIVLAAARKSGNADLEKKATASFLEVYKH